MRNDRPPHRLASVARFDEPEDEQASLLLCRPLMERLVTTLGGPLCSTLLVADNLEVIAHACRALAKLSDTNVTIQVCCSLVLLRADTECPARDGGAPGIPYCVVYFELWRIFRV